MAGTICQAVEIDADTEALVIIETLGITDVLDISKVDRFPLYSLCLCGSESFLLECQQCGPHWSQVSSLLRNLIFAQSRARDVSIMPGSILT